MLPELYGYAQDRAIYTQAHSAAWRSGIQVPEPSIWLRRDPLAEEKMLRDHDISHAIGFRCSAIAGRSWTLTPRRKTEKGQLAVDVGTELWGSVRRMNDGLRLLARAFFHGSRAAMIHGEMMELAIGDGKPRMWWVPKRLEDLDRRMFRIVPEGVGEDGQITARWERWDTATATWRPHSRLDEIATIRNTYQDEHGMLGYGRALREALGWVWHAKSHVFDQTMRSVERYAGGTITARIKGLKDSDGVPNLELVRIWQRVLENLRSKHVLVYDSEDEIDVIDGNGQGWQVMNEVRNECRSTVFTLVLGANLPTSADKGGSYALAEIQENSTDLIVQTDRDGLEESITDDGLGAIWHFNRANMIELGIHQDQPRFSISEERQEDPRERAEIASILLQNGVPLKRSELYEKTGWTMPADDEPVFEGQSQQQPQGFPGGNPFGFGDRWQDGRGNPAKGPNLFRFEDRRVPEVRPPSYARFREFREEDVKRDGGKFATKEGEEKQEEETESDRGFNPDREHWGDWSRSTLSKPVQQAVEDAAEKMQEGIDAALGKAREKGLGRERAEDLISGSYDTAKAYDDIASGPGANHSDSQAKELEDRIDAVGDSMAEYIDSVLDETYGKASRPLRGQERLDWLYQTGKITAEQAGRGSQFREFREEEVKRDGGKFAKQEGSGQGEEEKAQNETETAQESESAGSDSGEVKTGSGRVRELLDQEAPEDLEQRADAELSKLSEEHRAYLEGNADLSPDPTATAEDRAVADQAMGDLATAIDGALGAKPGTIGAAIGQYLQDVGKDGVRVITNPKALLRVALGAGILTAGTVAQAIRIYAKLTVTVSRLTMRAVQWTEDRTQKTLGEIGPSVADATGLDGGSDADSMGDAIEATTKGLGERLKDAAKQGLESFKRDFKESPFQTIVANGLIAVPFPGSADAGISIRQGFKMWNAFNPLDTDKGIGQSVKDALKAWSS